MRFEFEDGGNTFVYEDRRIFCEGEEILDEGLKQKAENLIEEKFFDISREDELAVRAEVDRYKFDV